MKLLILMVALAAVALAQTANVQRNVNLRADPSTSNPPLTLLTPPAVVTLLESTKQVGTIMSGLPLTKRVESGGRM
jgi:uncharacterized protein YraI